MNTKSQVAPTPSQDLVPENVEKDQKDRQNDGDSPAVNDFGHESWKKCQAFTIGRLNESTGLVEPNSVSTVAMGQRCHDLDRGLIKVMPLPVESANGPPVKLRAPDRDKIRRPMQPGEVPRDYVTRWASSGAGSDAKEWYVPFQVMPNMDDHPDLFERWEGAFLDLINSHRLPNTEPVTDLAHAHRVLPQVGTRAFGEDLNQLKPQTWLAERLAAEWAGEAPTTFLDIYAETIDTVVAPFMSRHYGVNRFHVQKHPKNLRLQMPSMKSVAHWHCDRMFGHQREINFVLCLTDFRPTGAGIAMEVDPGTAYPIVAGAGSIFSAPFGYKPHGNTVNVERDHTRVSLDWRAVPGGQMQASDEVGASATSGLPYAEGEYFTEWDCAKGGWVEPPRKQESS